MTCKKLEEIRNIIQKIKKEHRLEIEKIMKSTGQWHRDTEVTRTEPEDK